MENHFIESQRPILIKTMLDNMIVGEEIIWEGKADFRSYRWHKVYLFGVLLIPIMTVFSLPIIFTILLAVSELVEFFFILVMFVIPFMIVPFVFFIAKIWTVKQSWADTHYVITNMRIIIQSAGIVNREIKNSYFNEISGALLHFDLWDRKFYGTGTIRFKFNNLNFLQGSSSGRAACLNEIRHIKNVEIVYAKIQKKISEFRNMMSNPQFQYGVLNFPGDMVNSHGMPNAPGGQNQNWNQSKFD